MVKEGVPSPHEQIFWEYGDQLAAREGEWKLVLDGKLDFSRKQAEAVHLADLSKDPGERENLEDKEPDLAKRLTEQAKAWLEEVTS